MSIRRDCRDIYDHCAVVYRRREWLVCTDRAASGRTGERAATAINLFQLQVHLVTCSRVVQVNIISRTSEYLNKWIFASLADGWEIAWSRVPTAHIARDERVLDQPFCCPVSSRYRPLFRHLRMSRIRACSSRQKKGKPHRNLSNRIFSSVRRILLLRISVDNYRCFLMRGGNFVTSDNATFVVYFTRKMSMDFFTL